MSNNINIYVDQATDFSASIDVNTTTGTDYDFTGHTVHCSAKKIFSEKVAFNPIATPAMDSSSGNWLLTITLTRAMTADVPPGRYAYDIVMVSQEGIATKIIDGLITIIPTVTRVA
tara:strand:+ start:259 stop:606 length:348 start_codon:yes stop_codon:yes gene_type:complete